MSEASIVLPHLTIGQIEILWGVLISAFVALGYGLYLVFVVLRADPGPKSMTDVSDAVEQGAMAYLRRQVSTIAVFVLIIFAVLAFMYSRVYGDPFLYWGISIAF